MKLGTSGNSTIHLSADAIARHIYVVGLSGSGKSNLLEHITLSLIEENYGVAFFDRHGQSCEFIADRIPERRTQQTVYWEPFDTQSTIGYNPLLLKDTSDLEKSSTTERVLAAVSHAFMSGNAHNFYDEIELKILRNTIRLLLDNNGSLLDITRCLLEPTFRLKLLKHSTSASTTGFWTLEYDRWNDRQRVEYTASLLNKADAFLSNPIIARILSHNTLTLSKSMDAGEILLVNLSAGKMGSYASTLLGSLLTAGLSGAALARGINPKPFVLIIDEFAPFSNAAFVEMGTISLSTLESHY